MVRELAPAELGAAAMLLSRAMRDNPIDVRAFGIPDSGRRGRVLARFYAPVLRGLGRRGTVLGAFRDSRMVGVCGFAPPGRCQPGPLEKLTVFPSLMLGNRLSTPLRVARWVSEWPHRDPHEAHGHLGPVAVAPDAQGRGIGSAMVAEFCARIDDRAGLSYLETDKLENVGFYEKFGFSTVGEAQVLDVPNWFMSRALLTAPVHPGDAKVS
jgi:GNAT superfamily N-acetyltransferase